MKQVFSLFLSVMLVFTFLPAVFAEESNVSVEHFADGSYCITTLEDESSGITLLSVNTASKAKKTFCYSPTGAKLWYVKVTGTFTYGDGSAKCTASSVSAKSYSDAWSITKKSASKSGNKASATATAKKGKTSRTKTVTLTCSASGEFS